MKIYLTAIGMGTEATLTHQAKQAMQSADVLIGATRMLEAAKPYASQGAICVDAIAPSKVIAALNEYPTASVACILCSGDTGFFSLATSLRKELEALEAKPEVHTICGVTTAQYLASQAGMPWQDAKLASAHGRSCNILGTVLTEEKCFFLTGGEHTPATIIDMLNNAGLGQLCTLTIGERLSYEDQRITKGTAAELAGKEFDSLAALFAQHAPLAVEEARRACGCSAIPDELFVRGDAPMTKRDVRGLVSSHANLQAGEVAWDVGAGTGSISVEMACMQPFAQVVAIEREHEACQLIEENRKRFGAYNVQVVEGHAPQALEGLPTPDMVFIGGSAGTLEQVVELALQLNPNVRFIVTAITVETIAQTEQVFAKLAAEGRLSDYLATQIASAHSKKLGGYHLMRPESPIFIYEAAGVE